MKTLATVLLLLGAVALGLWTASIFDRVPAIGAATVADRPLQPPPNRPEAARRDGKRRQEDVAGILARPLFNSSRRPWRQAAGPAPAARPVTTLPRMTAILIDGKARSAIFEGDGKPIVLTEGGHMGPFTIQSIEAQQVTIIGPEGKRVIHTSFAASQPPPPSQPLPFALPTPQLPGLGANNVVLPPGFPPLGSASPPAPFGAPNPLDRAAR